jgi:photosystem II stability/assembly factor-like uncharacterized protein
MRTIITLLILLTFEQYLSAQINSPHRCDPATQYWSIAGSETSEGTENNPVFTWQPVQTPVTYQIIKVFFIDFLYGWASHNGNGALRSTDSGFNWITISFNDTNFSTLYNGVYFLDRNTGWIVGGSVQIRKTTNSGVNWFKQNAPPVAGVLNSIYFFDANTGLGIGRKTINYNSFICRTTNAGANWTEIVATTDNNNELHSQYWFDANNGWIAGRNTLLKSTNGGLNYTNLYANIPPVSNGQNELLCITFVNQQTGWIGGSNLDHKNIYITTNGGNSWSFQDNPAAGYSYSQINDMEFITQDSGWAIHGTPVTGAIMFTTNAGLNWVVEEGSNNWFNSISIYSRMKAWCGASSGEIWYSILSPTTGITKNNGEIPSKYNLYQNYPNPFNPSTTIKIDVPDIPLSRGVPAEQGVSVKLILYDILGRDIATLVNQYLKPGTYEITWDGSNYTSGIYFYKIIIGSYSETKRMVLLK